MAIILPDLLFPFYIGNVYGNSGNSNFWRKFALPFIKLFLETLFRFVLSMFYRNLQIKYHLEGFVQNSQKSPFLLIFDPSQNPRAGTNQWLNQVVQKNWFCPRPLLSGKHRKYWSTDRTIPHIIFETFAIFTQRSINHK